MFTLKIKNMFMRLNFIIICCALAFAYCGCKDKEDTNPPELPGESRLNGLAEGWDYMLVKKLETMGMLSPHVKALANEDVIHIAYFESNVPENQNETITYGIKYMVWRVETMESDEEHDGGTIVNIDNCQGLGFALDSNNTPAVAYQGGVVPMGGQEKQGDAMLSIMGNDDVWNEYTGGIGEVDEDRNPFYTDGLAGADLSIAFDLNRNVHIAYQFKWEGIDSYNHGFPDLLYINKDRNNLSGQPDEEPVEGNIYINNSTGYQNKAGYHCVIAIDKNDEPVIFYFAEFPRGGEFAENTLGLRVTKKQSDLWAQSEWVDEGCEIGFISNVEFDLEGNLAIAYYATMYTDDQGYSHTQCLKYASQDSSGSWQVQLVDESTLCGGYCSLAFDSSGAPAIAYHSLMSRSGYELKDLKLARFNGLVWNNYIVASGGDVGYYNKLMFNKNDKLVICSFSNTDKAIYLFYQQM